ncbi:TnsA-like heteromeric transposase endonuclease subunit [Cryobacterium sp. RTC2.1]|uniref:TnsA-like heteromeric transposase endonuclease subunit n=1 Tax=Cryobacterium sp. RTC2.1 TaxID=3048634 RepID=UPI002B233CBF|nr:TnsA-like heteromeric transposase endonuclease subunit [Cryobacterium sp. RTC2.1]MEB0004932.1 TnsA-like heteromeric transposase endonuclease subunit [Cryobacterium sp. RTC2.1]
MADSLVASARLSEEQGLGPTTQPRKPEIRWLDSAKRVHAAKSTPDLLHEHFQTNASWRVGTKYPGRRNFHGWYWFSGSAQHVQFESGFEQTALMVFDFDGDVVGISAQPFQIDFGRKRAPATHVPDFFLVRRDGTQVVVDVRPVSRLDDKAKATFLETRDVCRGIGWNYDVFAWIDHTYQRNLEWLAGYRHPRNAPPAELETELLRHFEQPARIGDVITSMPIANPPMIMAWSYHLLWRRVLTTDLGRSLSKDHLIQLVHHA